MPVPGAQFEETLASASPDVLREMVREFAQRMMDADVEVRCNAGYGEVTPDRVNSRNGYRRREWDTRAGTIEDYLTTCTDARIGVRGNVAVRRLANTVTFCDGHGVFFVAASGQFRPPTLPLGTTGSPQPVLRAISCVDMTALTSAASDQLRSDS